MQQRLWFVYIFLQLWITQVDSIRTVYGFPQPESQFEDWYEQYGFVFANALRNNCTQQYELYRYGVGNTFHAKWVGFNEPIVTYSPGSNITIDFNSGGDAASAITQPLILCILNNTSDYIKSAMSSAQVLLGLTPTILALLGPSPMELSLLTIVAKRPGLALLLALACPSVYLSRAFDSTSPLDILKERPGRLPQWRPKGVWRGVLITAQYLIAFGSLSNVAVLYYQLGVRTICVFFPNGTVVPLIWGVLVLPIHLVATLVFRLQVRRLYRDDDLRSSTIWQWIKGTPKRIKELRRTEFVPAALQKQVYMMTFPETKRLIGINWLLTPGIIIHVIFGTLVLSSLTFIGPRDALEVVGRYMVSVLIARAILMYEIAGVRDRFNSDDGGLVLELPFQEHDDLIVDPENAMPPVVKQETHHHQQEYILEIANPAQAQTAGSVYHRSPPRAPMRAVRTAPAAMRR
ncbi:hypothetical protein F4777DRAFT_563355 [Nemania sp. FL0916]|nr:hypothetical protein F4777DRAFT_563355 [Nemania sp. FL0916]